MNKRQQIIRFENEAKAELLVGGHVPREKIQEMLDAIPPEEMREYKRILAKHDIPDEAVIDLVMAQIAQGFDIPLPRERSDNIEAHDLTVPKGIKMARGKLDLN
jgi:hypothetical protein